MKNYFNSQEQARHLILLLASEMANELITNESPSDNEIKVLRRIVKDIDNFSEMVFSRLGEGYKRSLRNKARMNTIRVCSKNTTSRSPEMQDTIDADILRDIIEKYGVECEGCNDTNCTKCDFYKIRSYLGIKGESRDDNMCPFRKENNFDIFDWDIEK